MLKLRLRRTLNDYISFSDFFWNVLQASTLLVFDALCFVLGRTQRSSDFPHNPFNTTKLKKVRVNRIDPDKNNHMSHLIWIYTVWLLFWLFLSQSQCLQVCSRICLTPPFNTIDFSLM